jgi:hypothetical protein
MSDYQQPFSTRHGYRAEEVEITVREDAPEALRSAVTMLGYGLGQTPEALRSAICEVLLTRADIDNWSPSNVEREVNDLVDGAPWYKVYDIAEKLYVTVGQGDYTGTKSAEYEGRLNEVFRANGIGWQMESGLIVARGSEAFAIIPKEAVATMRAAGKQSAAREVHEALTDISRRPQADVTGAIQHAMAALECVARDVVGTKDTLGAIVARLGLPKPLDAAVTKLWGFTSEEGRHIQEGRDPRFEEAELVVTVASSVSIYLLRADARAKVGS